MAASGIKVKTAPKENMVPNWPTDVAKTAFVFSTVIKDTFPSLPPLISKVLARNFMTERPIPINTEVIKTIAVKPQLSKITCARLMLNPSPIMVISVYRLIALTVVLPVPIPLAKVTAPFP